MRAATLLDGSLAGGFSDRLGDSLAALLREEGWSVHRTLLREGGVGDCTGCFGCWVRTPGECVLDDAGRQVARQVILGDLVVFLTPVTFGGYSSLLKAAVDRLLPLGSPFFAHIGGETHHRPRYARYPRLLGVGTLSAADPEAEGLFRTLVARNAMNLHCPGFAAGVFPESVGAGDLGPALRALLARAGALP